MLYNDSTQYKYFKIDAKDIWEYERNYYNLVDKNWNFISNLYELIQEVFIQSGASPIQEIPKNPDGGTKSRIEAYNNFDERNLVLDFFIRGNKLYDLNISCLLDKEKIDIRIYQYFFACKLRQYNGDISSVFLFLDYHFKKTFKKNKKAVIKFLEAVLLQHNKLFTTEVSKVAYKWMQERIIFLEDKTVETSKVTYEHIIPKLPISAIVSNQEILLSKNQPEESDADLPVLIKPEIDEGIKHLEFEPSVPKDYHYYKGKLHDSEVQEFFSFLYLAKDKENQSYLKKEEVENIFQYGIAIPPVGKTVRYKLNTGGARNKKIVLYAIYVFYNNYKFNVSGKRLILRFFASYIEDFAFALLNEEEMEKLSKYMTGERPSKNFFNLEKYVPVRLQDHFKMT